MTTNPGVHIVFNCCRCPARFTTPALNHSTIDSALERARELKWTFQPDGETEDGAVVCPSCSKNSAAGGRSPARGGDRLRGQPEPAADSSANNAEVNPWQPMTRPIDLKHLGKLGEECGELSAAVSRCIIQGIDEHEPVTGKSNREWLEDEIADIIANTTLVRKHFNLDRERIFERVVKKMTRLRAWHSMLEPAR